MITRRRLSAGIPAGDHLNRCDDCRAFSRALAILDHDLPALSSPAAPHHLSTQIKELILQGADPATARELPSSKPVEQSVNPPQPRREHPAPSPWSAAVAGFVLSMAALAAVLLVFLAANPGFSVQNLFQGPFAVPAWARFVAVVLKALVSAALTAAASFSGLISSMARSFLSVFQPLADLHQAAGEWMAAAAAAASWLCFLLWRYVITQEPRHNSSYPSP
ncbi:MAG: hypothetical protein HYY09_03250 [Firmicutes bacterium]|nr:hypothetical protein [Bacillota bacterium]